MKCSYVIKNGEERGKPCNRKAWGDPPRCGIHTKARLEGMTGRKHCRCGVVIREHHWRDPTRCLDCYLALKVGATIVCTAGDVRMLDNVPGGFATSSAPKVIQLEDET